MTVKFHQRLLNTCLFKTVHFSLNLLPFKHFIKGSKVRCIKKRNRNQQQREKKKESHIQTYPKTNFSLHSKCG